MIEESSIIFGISDSLKRLLIVEVIPELEYINSFS